MSITAAQIGRVAEAYTEAWCSRSGIKVATFFSDNATSTINKGEPSVGRAAIADAFEAFFLDLPDLVLYMDDLRTAGNQAIYLWTLEGTHRETGHFVHIPGWQSWVLSADLHIAQVEVGYDTFEYDRQLREGI